MRHPRLLKKPVGKLLGLAVIAGVLLAGMTFPFAAIAGKVSNDAGDALDTVSTDVVDGQLPQVTTVTDSAGAPLAYLYDQYRTSVATESIAPAMKAAMVAIEDRRFYVHEGVDWQATVRAIVANSASGDVVQGASTLTQQYVKNYLLYVAARTESERLKATEQNIARKIKEARLAMQVEGTLSKDEILTRYLNIVFWGNNAYGIAAAAQTYFDTTPDKLTVPQAALLAGMVRSSTAFDPIKQPQAAIERRNLVIGEMAGQGMITQVQADEALAAPIGVANPLRAVPNGCTGAGDVGFFCKYVVEYLTDAGFSTDQLNRGGYTIKTTMDRNAMIQIKRALDGEVPPTAPHVANVMSIVAPGADKHRVLAMGSSRTFGLKAQQEETSYGLPYEPVNLGAGSTYKIFTAAAALEKGLGINYQMTVPPSGYTSPIYKDGSGKPIPVKNGSTYSDKMSMTDALAASPNTAFIKLEEFTGIAPVVDMAVKLGLRSLATTPFVDPRTGKRTDRSIAQVTKDQKLASFTLGPTPTSVLELANVGATLASAGKWCPPSPIEAVTDLNARAVPVPEAPCEQVVEPGLANTLMNGLGKDHVSGGTAAGAAGSVGWKRPVAGKTGTTETNKSAAFVGVVPQMSGAVITFDNSRSPRPLCDGAGPPFPCSSGNIFGGKTPARTWFVAMTAILAGQPALPLPPPDPRYLEGGAQTKVPDVVGRSQREATAILQRANWQVSVRSVDNAAPAGTVINQNPRGNALPGEAIILDVSNGKGVVEPPPGEPPPEPPPGEPPPGGPGG